jgi:hypothetical protein
VRGKNYETTLFNEEFSYKVPHDFKDNLLTFWDEKIDRCIIYNQIMDEMDELEYEDYQHELSYRLGDGENINDILLSIITRTDEVISTLGYHRGSIQMFLDQDFMKMFK